jgi:hypothetical protein
MGKKIELKAKVREREMEKIISPGFNSIPFFETRPADL